MSKVGFIGLGIMGAPMAGHLLKGGHELFVHDAQPRAAGTARRRRRRPCESGRGGGASRPTSIITMVPDTPRRRSRCCSAPTASPTGLTRGQDRRRHELDLADRNQGVRHADQRAGLRLPRRAGLGRRGRREGRQR